MINEEVVCTPDLVVSNFRVEEFKQYPPGTKIQVREPLFLMPPIETNIQDDRNLTENFRETIQSIIKNLTEMSSKISQIEKQLENSNEEDYYQLYNKFVNEINRVICSLNITKSRLFLDYIKVQNPSSSTSADNSSPSITTPTPNNVICNGNLNKSRTSDKNNETNSPLNFFENVPTDAIESQHFMLNEELPNSIDVESLDDRIVENRMKKKKEILAKRRIYRIEQKLKKQMKPCKVKLVRENLEQLRMNCLKNHSLFQEVIESNQSLISKPKSILIISPNRNRSKKTKKVRFAPKLSKYDE